MAPFIITFLEFGKSYLNYSYSINNLKKNKIKYHQRYNVTKLFPKEKTKICFKLVFLIKTFKERKHHYILNFLFKCNDYETSK